MINDVGKWARKLIAEPITGIWSFVNGLKTDTISEYGTGNGVTIDGLKIKDGYINQNLGVGAASAGEKLEAGKDTDVSGIIGRGFFGYNGTHSDTIIASHIDFKLYPMVRQSSSGHTYIDTGGTLTLSASGSGIAQITVTGLALTSGKTLTTIYVSDTDSDTNDVLSTGITAKFALVLIKETSGNKFCIFRIKGDNSAPVIIDGDAEFTVTKDTASSYNFYYESDQYKLQNKVGDNKALYVGLYCV